MPFPFAKAPTWKEVKRTIIEFEGEVEEANFAFEGMPPVYRFRRKGRVFLFPVKDERERVPHELLDNIVRILGLPTDAFGKR